MTHVHDHVYTNEKVEFRTDMKYKYFNVNLIIRLHVGLNNVFKFEFRLLVLVLDQHSDWLFTICLINGTADTCHLGIVDGLCHK